MKPRDEITKGLESCILRDPDDKMRCAECPYNDGNTLSNSNCLNRLKMDALALLKMEHKTDFVLMKNMLECAPNWHEKDNYEIYNPDSGETQDITLFDGADQVTMVFKNGTLYA